MNTFFAGFALTGGTWAQNHKPVDLLYTGETWVANHTEASLSVAVRNGTGGPVSDGDITFTLGSQTCKTKPDAAGKAVCRLLLDQPPGRYALRALFSNSASVYAGASSLRVDFLIK